jgi:hypothetical protein
MRARVSIIGPAVRLAPLSLAAQPTPPNWPRFRGPNAAGIADGEHLPTRWAGTSGANIRCKVPIAGLAHSSPIVWGDRRSSEDGDMFVVTAGPSFSIVSTNPMGEPLMATPAIVDRTMHVRGQHLFAIANTPK